MTKTCILSPGLGFNFSLTCFLVFSIAVHLNDGLNEEVLKYTNQFRQSKGLTALVMRDELNVIARRHSEDMAKGRCGFGHSGYSQREQQAQKTIKPFYGMAENVAYGATTAKEVVSLWK